MLTFRKTNIIFVLALVLLAGLNFTRHISIWIYILLFIAYTLILFYGSYFIHSNFYIPVICSGPSDKKQIAISFDDGPADQYTEELLQILKANQIPAAFFCIGRNIPGRESILRKIHEDGHLIGNHSFSHDVWFDLFSSGKMLSDLQMMDRQMQDTLGFRPRLFRPPYGVTNPNLARAIQKGGYTPLGWNIRSLDTMIKNEQKLLQRVVHGLKPGAVILFHDSGQATISILPKLIGHAKEQGFVFSRLDKMLNLDPYV